MATFQLPDVGEGLTEAEIVRWLVEPGQHVDVNQMLCEIETAKALVELPSPFEGTVEELHAKPGDVVPVGGDLVTVQTREPVLVGYGTSEEKPVRRRRRTVGPPGAQTKPVRHGGFEVARSTEEKLAHQEIGRAHV